MTKIEFVLVTATCSLFLILGLTLPMIEIDARISEIKLSLLGEQLSFQDQVLYYKSKSILEVVTEQSAPLRITFVLCITKAATVL